jgi:hypothetical protein
MFVSDSQATITAFGFAACRHGVINCGVNLFHGERHAYPLLIVHTLVNLHVTISFFWYDIACRFKSSLGKWRARQDPGVQAMTANTTCIVPPFHVHSHRYYSNTQLFNMSKIKMPFKVKLTLLVLCSYTCQLQNGHLYTDGPGTGTGEVCEIINAKLVGLRNSTKYQAPVNRDGTIEHVCAELR